MTIVEQTTPVHATLPWHATAASPAQPRDMDLPGWQPGTPGTPVQRAVNMQPRVVHVHDGLTPVGARALNLVEVTAALDAAGIEHFAVRGMDDRTGVVGVSERDRAAVFKALGRVCETRHGYVTPLVPAPPVATSLLRGNSRATWQTVATTKVLRMVWFRAEPTLNLLYGADYGCDIEFWTPDAAGQRLTAPRPNRMTRRVELAQPPVNTTVHQFTRLAPHHHRSTATVPTRAEFTHTLPEDLEFPVDVVYTWVDGRDEAWKRKRAQYTGQAYHPEAASDARFINRDELRYSLRSLHMFAPWVRNIYIATDDQVPSWLDESAPNIKVVSHREFFKDPSALPTFNSCAIESQLHRIDGLAEHFLYFNDDMFLGRPVAPQSFFLSNGLQKFFLSTTRVPFGDITEADTPTDATVKNNRRLLEQMFGRVVAQATQHVPYPVRRSIVAELEERFPQEFHTTMTSRLRSMDQLSVTYQLQHYYAYQTGRALPGSVRYGYIQLAVADLAERLERLLIRRDWDTFCLNDAYSTEDDIIAQNAVLQPFFEAYFPVPSPYEKRA